MKRCFKSDERREFFVFSFRAFSHWSFFSEIREIREFRWFRDMRFSLISLNSLHSLPPGIVFDTCVTAWGFPLGSSFPLFNCRVSFSIPMFEWVRSSCVPGIVFDTCMTAWDFPLGSSFPLFNCRVSFSIPMWAWEPLLKCVGTFPLCAGYRFRYLRLRGAFSLGGSFPLVCRVSFSIRTAPQI